MQHVRSIELRPACASYVETVAIFCQWLDLRLGATSVAVHARLSSLPAKLSKEATTVECVLTKLGITEFNAIGDRIPSSMGAFDKESSIITINIPEDEATEETIATFKGSLRTLANISFTDLKGGLLKKASTMRVGRAGRDARAGAKRAKPSDGEEALGQM